MFVLSFIKLGFQIAKSHTLGEIMHRKLVVAGMFQPYKKRSNNIFSDFTLYILVVLYVLYMMEENRSFWVVVVISLLLSEYCPYFSVSDDATRVAKCV